MPAIVHCVRHAQGLHNLGPEYHGVQDPPLTELGKSQAASLRDSLGLDFQSRLSLITASPLTRTIHTAVIAFAPALSSSTPICNPAILALPTAQEISDFPCDTGSEPSLLSTVTTTNSWPVDHSLIHPGWNDKSLFGPWAPTTSAIFARARATRLMLREKLRGLESQGIQDPEIVLVTHGGFLHYMTGDWEGANDRFGTGWANCEIRSYTFDDTSATTAEADVEAYMVETAASRTRRGKQGPMKARPEQEELYRDALKGWENDGLRTPEHVDREAALLKEKETKRESEGGVGGRVDTGAVDVDVEMNRVEKVLSRASATEVEVAA